MSNLSGTKETDSVTSSNIYVEIARLNFTQERKSTLLSYFTVNDKAEASAEKALAVCNNDDEKLAYLNKILMIIDKNSDLPEKSRSTKTESVNDADLKTFVQKLELKLLDEYEPLKYEDIRKFYEFAGPNFTWPSTSRISERRVIYDYITDPDSNFVGEEGEELARNTLAYRRLIESGCLDSSKGSHIHIVNGKFVGYGQEIFGKECCSPNSTMSQIKPISET